MTQYWLAFFGFQIIALLAMMFFTDTPSKNPVQYWGLVLRDVFLLPNVIVAVCCELWIHFHHAAVIYSNLA